MKSNLLPITHISLIISLWQTLGCRLCGRRATKSASCETGAVRGHHSRPPHSHSTRNDVVYGGDQNLADARLVEVRLLCMSLDDVYLIDA